MTVTYFINVDRQMTFRVTRRYVNDRHGFRFVRVYIIYDEPGHQVVKFMELGLPGHESDPVNLE
jgi:hypothetical protein